MKINTEALAVENSAARLQHVQKYNNSKFYTYYNYLSLEEGRINQEVESVDGEILVCNLNYCAHYETVDISKHGIVFF